MTRALRVGGLVPLTTLDYPGMLACVLFCQGCAWRCRYCHNPDLIPPRGSAEVDWRRVLLFLQRRQDLLDAVVFSGGEPTLQEGLPAAMDEVREMGFRIGLHSAGIKPASFANALAHADWVGSMSRHWPKTANPSPRSKVAAPPTGTASTPCWPAASTTNAAPRCTGT